jgi:hypothetical protein
MKIQLNWACKVFSPQSSSTNRIVWRYFETIEEAEKVSNKVVWRPGHAWRWAS